MKKRLKECPECSQDTVVEIQTEMGVPYKIERCDGLIVIEDDGPLVACMWSQVLGIVRQPQKQITKKH